MPEFWLDRYVEEMPKIEAQSDLRLFNMLCVILPAHSEQELGLRKEFIKELQSALGDETKPVLKSMPVKDAATLSMLGGFGAVVSGPPIAHGIGTRKAGFKNDGSNLTQ